MTLEQRIRQLEQEADQIERVARLTEAVLAQLMKSSPPPAELEQVRHSLRSASDLLKHNERETSEQLARQAEEALHALRQWLAVADLGISPFFLRNYLEKNQPDRERQQTLIRYFFRKQPHAENDRDKLDYLLAAYFAPRDEPAFPSEQLPAAVQELFADLPPRELNPATEIMLHELTSLIARVEDFTDFDQMVHARMVERARALKINLGEDFYHPRILPTVIHFNVAFRQRFEKLFHEQLKIVRQGIRQQIEEAWALTRAIEAASEKVALPETQRAGLAASEGQFEEAFDAPVGRPLEAIHERLPIDRLLRRGQEPQKENELRGIITRLGRFLEKLPPQQAKAEKVVFLLRETKIELAPWEREAFRPAAAGTAPESVRAIQTALGVIAWMEEELARYKRTRDDRYLWKTHFDLLSYAVIRAVDLLKSIRGLVHEHAPAGEAAWFGPLLQTSLRLATTLNKIAPVFAEPA
ncbi:hypothetical protein MYX77_01495 [Acidobacteriia bacterium AH_259_A11_L15]|nr:hypothetical protein [Acidobacteriia bacterium AH_259_A11_L15]